MKSPNEPGPEFLVGCAAITEFVNGVLKPAKLTQHQIYRLLEKRRLPAGKIGAQYIARPAKLRESLMSLADGGDSLDPSGDNPADETK
jgi:hypothetical protein